MIFDELTPSLFLVVSIKVRKFWKSSINKRYLI